ncbi:MAG: hypothetical protein GX150_04535 [Firmicutes bacterium]|nr:hypothetical protein [Bacillota bacterium]
MPSVKVLSPQIAPERRGLLAKCLYADMKEFLKAPIIEVFYLTLDGVYANGEENTGSHAILEVEGPDIKKEFISRLSINLCKSFQNESGYPDCHVAVVYHVNDKDHVGSIDGLLSERSK